MQQSYSKLYQIASSNRRKQLIVGWGAIAVGAVSFFIFDERLYKSHGVIIQMAASACLIFGLYAVVHAWRMQKLEKNPILQSLKNSPNSIVWIYSYVTINMPFGIRLFKTCNIYVNFRNGSQHYISIDANRYSEITNSLQNDLPHATFGYTVQREQLFRVNPTMLYRD